MALLTTMTSVMSPLFARYLLPLMLACGVVRTGSAQDMGARSDNDSDVNREYLIKAAYLYQFGRYVQWPANAFTHDDSPLMIGVLGADPFGGILEKIALAKRIEGRPIAVRRFASMAEYIPCHILFVSSSVSPEHKAAAIHKARQSAVLLVGEEPGFAEQGGTVNFFLDENRVRFEINMEIAKQDQLKISSKLLTLAKIVGRY